MREKASNGKQQRHLRKKLQLSGTAGKSLIQSSVFRRNPSSGWPLSYSQPFRHLFVEEAFAGPAGLDPLSLNDELWNGPVAGLLHHFAGT